MSYLTDDERVWVERFQKHIDDNILSLISSLSSKTSLRDCLTAEHVLQQLSSSSQDGLHSHLFSVPVEFDILTIKFLTDNFKTSFQAGSLFEGHARGDESPTDTDSPISDSHLNAVPALLIGILNLSSTVHGGLVLGDATGNIECELCHLLCEVVDLEYGGQVVVLLQWNFIHSNSSKCKSYLEIQELVPVWRRNISTTASPPTADQICSASGLKDRMSKKLLSKKCRISVYGMVTAVSEVLRSGSKCFFFVKIVDTEDSSSCHNIIIQNSDLLHLSHFLKMSEIYLFTQLRDMVVKGLSVSDEQRVLATTSETRILPYNHQDFSLSPSRKRIRISTETSLVATSNCSCSQDNGDSEKQLDTKFQVPCLQTECSSLISYKGVITRCVLPEAGVYELDGRVLLYLTRCESTNMGRGLRCGATLELHNVHVLKIQFPPLKHASGFCCCALSSVRVVQFSKLVSPFKAFVGRNKLASLTKKYAFTEIAWIIETYLSLNRKEKRYDVRTRFVILEEMCSSAALSPLCQDINTEFLASPHCCQPIQKHMDLSEKFQLSDLKDVLSEVKELFASGGFRWSGCHEDSPPKVDSNPVLVYAVSSRWSFGIVKSSQLQYKKVLLGELQGCSTSGYINLVDSTESIPVVCCLPATSQSPHHSRYLQSCRNTLARFGSRVMVTDFSFFVERIVEGHDKQQSTKLQLYLFPKESKIFPPTPLKSVKATPDMESVQGVKEDQNRLYFMVLSKNTITQQPSTHQACSFSVQAYIHTDADLLKKPIRQDRPAYVQGGMIERALNQPLSVALCFLRQFFSYINNRCIYSLTIKDTTAGSKLPTLKALAQEPSVNVTNDMIVEFMEIVPPDVQVFPAIMDVAEVISRLFLPKFQTSSSIKTPFVKERRFDGELVTLRGIVLKHSYRIDHMTLMGPAASVNTDTPLQTSPSQIITLTVRSLNYPDTIMVYCNFGQGMPLPIGLLPGATATFHSFRVKSSKLGNIYCISCPCSSIVINSLDGVEALSPTSDLFDAGTITLEMVNLPPVYLGDLMSSLLQGCLSGRIVCILGRIASVLRLSIQYVCLGCQNTIVDGQCMVACLQRKPTLKAEARLLIEDGSGEGHVYISGEVLRHALGVSHVEWRELCDMVVKIGYVVYSRPFQAGNQEATNRFSMLDKAKQKITAFATRNTLQRTVKLYCQPFVSQAELRESVIGQKCHVMRQYNTLALPRLQLRAIALLEMNSGEYIKECEHLLEILNPE